jgi:hypothetical protein
MNKTFWLLSKLDWAITFKSRLFPLEKLLSKLNPIPTALLWQSCLKPIKALA